MPSTNAIDLLKEDHKRVKELLTELEGTTNRAAKRRVELLQKIKKELEVHTHIEEEIFYPAFKEAGGAEHKKMFFEAKEEHRAVDQLVMPDLGKTEATSEEFQGRAKVLKELIEHHVQEEEKEMFPKAKKSMSNDQLKELGEQMMARKEELQKQMTGKAAA